MTNQTEKISKETFVKRLVTLLVKSGLSEFPKNKNDQLIILQSVLLTFKGAKKLTEKEVNEQIDTWIRGVGQVNYIDRVSIRRLLIDYGFLERAKDGSVYSLVEPQPYAELFADEINEVQVFEELERAREEIRSKRERYQAK
ncbi:MAG: DUF2087 domain-containing protein [Anaerolineales bacterium]